MNRTIRRIQTFIYIIHTSLYFPDDVFQRFYLLYKFTKSNPLKSYPQCVTHHHNHPIKMGIFNTIGPNKSHIRFLAGIDCLIF